MLISINWWVKQASACSPLLKEECSKGMGIKVKNLKSAYFYHKSNSATRNIQFLLTYDEWLQIWKDSGHLHERGCHKDQYVMARFGDMGPYSVENVKIILHKQNIQEAQAGRAKASKGVPRSVATKTKIAKTLKLKGIKPPSQ